MGNKKCKKCDMLLNCKQKRNIFCSSSCAATFNNLNRIPKIGFDKKCKICNKNIHHKRVYCSTSCAAKYKNMDLWNKFTNQVLETKEIDAHPQKVKKWLLLTYGNKCSICGIEEWMGQKAPLVADHIDGNSCNNNVCNLRLVCGNCDMQLPTYKAKNLGNGRYSRRQRYKEGKSF